MSDQLTVPHRVTRVPVQSLSVEALDGPDKGRALDVSGDALVIGTAADANLVLTDATVSRYHLDLRLVKDGILARDLGSTNGSFIGPVRIVDCVVPPGTILRLGRSSVRVVEGRPGEVEQSAVDAVAGLRGLSPKMRRVFAQLDRAAQSDASVLVIGESGTGKELVARALHDLGPRRGRPFVTVDCGSLAPTLIASELFGHERGAFTGADRQHVGAFEQADGGTIFLDELGELPAQLQASLLGVLERRRFKRLGGRSEIGVDVRVVSATHRDLRSAVNASAFRLDLFYRLAVVTIELPPLRDRREDVPLLVAHFLRECGHGGDVDDLVPPPAMLDLMAHTWPGNVRELRNVVESTVTMGHPPSLRGSAMPPALDVPAPAPPSAAGGDLIESLVLLPYKDARLSILNAFESRYLTVLLERAEGNVSRAAREARVDRSHLIELLQRHGIRRPR